MGRIMVRINSQFIMLFRPVAEDGLETGFLGTSFWGRGAVFLGGFGRFLAIHKNNYEIRSTKDEFKAGRLSMI